MTITPETYGCVIREESGEELMVIPPRAMKLLSTKPKHLPESLRSTREALELALNVPSCYAVYNPLTQHIKIGSSVHPLQRLCDLQIGSPTTLHLLMVWHAVAPLQLEAFVQEELSEFRVRGEWFDARGAADALPALRLPATTPHPAPSIVKPPARIGRPFAVTKGHLDQAKTLLSEGHRVGDVAKTLGVGRSTLYRALRDEAA